MIADNYVYLNDRGETKATEQLPKTFAGMTNDPYISLVSFIRDDKQNIVLIMNFLHFKIMVNSIGQIILGITRFRIVYR